MEDYSKKLLDYFLNPKNVGEIDSPDGTGLIGDPGCGDLIKVTLRIDDDRIVDIKFKCKGCPAAIGTTSAMTEMALGLTLSETTQITPQKIEEAVGGLPDKKRHCSNLGTGALQRAIRDYMIKKFEQQKFIQRGMNVFY